MAKGDITRKLNRIGMGKIYDMIAVEDLSYSQIARKLKVSASGLQDWIAKDTGRYARARMALEEAAHDCDHKALQVIKALPADGTTAQIVRMRELAQYYRWRAAVRCPWVYGRQSAKPQTGTVTITVVPWCEEPDSK